MRFVDKYYTLYTTLCVFLCLGGVANAEAGRQPSHVGKSAAKVFTKKQDRHSVEEKPREIEFSLESLTPYLAKITVVTINEASDSHYGATVKNGLYGKIISAFHKRVDEVPVRCVGYDAGFQPIKRDKDSEDSDDKPLRLPQEIRDAREVVEEFLDSRVAVILMNENEKRVQEVAGGKELAEKSNISYGHCKAAVEIKKHSDRRDIDKKNGWESPQTIALSVTLPTITDNCNSLSCQMLAARKENRFTPSPNTTVKMNACSEKFVIKVQIHDLLSGKVKMESLADKYVLVGSDHEMLDTIRNPSGEKFNGVFFHAISLAALLKYNDEVKDSREPVKIIIK